jgi:hypothetical protein
MHRLFYAAIAVCVLVAAVSVITHSANDVIGTTTTAPARHYYLTKGGTFDGAHILTACASGYHTAAFYEIHEPTSLTYNKTLGFNLADSGQGPPVATQGWVRTGLLAEVSNTAGVANCNVWTSNSSSDFGTRVQLGVEGIYPDSIVAPWDQFTQPCNLAGHVWCVQN